MTHHPQGPSRLQNLDPESGGCSAFVPSEGTNWQAETGTLQHRVWVSGEYALLGGDEALIREVEETQKFFEDAVAAGGYDGQIKREERLEIPHLNFGTTDLLVPNSKGNRILLGDAKFGWWRSADARRNLQLLNYVAFVFYNYPAVRHVRAILYQAKHRRGTVAGFYRASLPKLISRIRRIVERAQRTAVNPIDSDFTPHPVNCERCFRLNCPARLALASAVITNWAGKPVSFAQTNLLELSLEHLATLKLISGPLKTFLTALDAEVKRRAFDHGELIPGYEIRTRNGERTIVGIDAINRAVEGLQRIWNAQYPEADLFWGIAAPSLLKLSVTDLEKTAASAVPRGKAAAAIKAIGQELETLGVVTSDRLRVIAQIKEEKINQ